MPKPLFNLSKKTINLFKDSVKLDKSLKKCTYKKCNNIIQYLYKTFL